MLSYLLISPALPVNALLKVTVKQVSTQVYNIYNVLMFKKSILNVLKRKLVCCLANPFKIASISAVFSGLALLSLRLINKNKI